MQFEQGFTPSPDAIPSLEAVAGEVLQAALPIERKRWEEEMREQFEYLLRVFDEVVTTRT